MTQKTQIERNWEWGGVGALLGGPLPGQGSEQFAWAVCVEGCSRDGWAIRAEFIEQGGLPVLRGLWIHPEATTPEGGITTRLLRSITLTQALDVVRSFGAEMRPHAGPELGAIVESVATADLHRRPGRQPRPDAEYAEVAVSYDRLLRQGSRAPISELARELHCSKERARDLVWRARKLGYLTPTKRGRSAGAATPHALAVHGRTADGA